jgi:hypothetical protein
VHAPILSVYTCHTKYARGRARKKSRHILICGAVHTVGHVSVADVETCTPAYTVTARQNRSVVHYSNKLNPAGGPSSPAIFGPYCRRMHARLPDGNPMHTAACRPICRRPILAAVWINQATNIVLYHTVCWLFRISCVMQSATGFGINDHKVENRL